MVVPNGMLASGPYFTLSDSEVHVWHTSLEQSREVTEKLSATLSEVERKRAGRFHFEQHRQFFVAARGILRFLLFSYTGIEPVNLNLAYTRAGKPFLANQDGASELCFNLSHSGGLVMYAFSRRSRIGIDIEYMRPIGDMEQIAAQNFSPNEYKKFKAVREESRMRAFYNCWTRKEAFIKAIGEGISFPLKQFEVSLEPDEPVELISLFGSEENAKQWTLHQLKTSDSFAAALVIEGKGHTVLQRDWAYIESI